MAQKRKLTDERIVAVVKQLEAGRTPAEMAGESGWREENVVRGRTQ